MKSTILKITFAVLSFSICFATSSGVSAAMKTSGYIAAGAQPLQVTCTSRIWDSNGSVPATFPKPETFVLAYKFLGDGSFSNLGGTARILVSAGDVIASLTRGVNSPHELVLEIYDQPGLASKNGLDEIATKADVNLFTFKSRRTYMAGESSVAFGGVIADQGLQINCSL